MRDVKKTDRINQFLAPHSIGRCPNPQLLKTFVQGFISRWTPLIRGAYPSSTTSPFGKANGWVSPEKLGNTFIYSEGIGGDRVHPIAWEKTEQKTNIRSKVAVYRSPWHGRCPVVRYPIRETVGES